MTDDAPKTPIICPFLSPVVPGALGKPTILVVECLGERCGFYNNCRSVSPTAFPPSVS